MVSSSAFSAAGPLLIRFLRAVTRARAEGEHAWIKRVEELTEGGQVIEERTEEMFNEKTGVRRVVTVRRLTPGDWRGHFALLDRMDKLAAARSEPQSPTGARPPEGQGGKGMDFQEIVRQAYELSHTRAPDPRALSPGLVKKTAAPEANVVQPGRGRIYARWGGGRQP